MARPLSDDSKRAAGPGPTNDELPDATGNLVVVGAINVDLAVHVERLPGPGETTLGPGVERGGGGKGANAAIAAARLGGSVSLVGAVGDDHFAEGALAELGSEKVDIAHVSRTHGVATGVALIAVDRDGQNQIAVGGGANLALTRKAVAEAMEELLPSTGCVLVSLEIPDPAAETALQMAREAGVTAVLNPAPARASVNSMLRWNPVVTPNLAEARQLTGRTSPSEAGSIIAAETGRSVIVTMAERGALLCRPGGEASPIPALSHVAVLDTTGAGDVFNGGLSLGLSRGQRVGVAAAYASQAAGHAVSAVGARAGMPRAEQLKGFTAPI